MLRIPNPGSDIDSFIRIYQELFDALRQQAIFDLDDMSRTLVERNLATSCGYMGEQALLRSTRKDRSRDPLYNQSKMYSELYRALGWIHPTVERALQFRFTYLGAHAAKARRDRVAVFRESILGIVYPNSILNVQSGYALRPFSAILRTIEALDGLICRDEMIVGPLCLEDDRDDQRFSAMVEELRSLRGNWSKLDQKMMKDAARKFRTKPISRTTMENYTRFPIAVLKWTGWTLDQRVRHIYERSVPFLKLTDEGRRTLNTIQTHQDIRAADLDDVGSDTKSSIVRIGFYQMLDRAGFDIDPVRDQLSVDQRKAIPLLGDAEASVLFSPFQDLPPDYTRSLFPNVSGPVVPQPTSVITPLKKGLYAVSPLSSRVSLRVSDTPQRSHLLYDLVTLFKKTVATAGDIDRAVKSIAGQYRESNQDEFYPLIANLFRALGYKCEYSRAGVNYQRWDAFIFDPKHSIPIEIKSPGEEEFLSVKAVRQALENKIILLARKPFPTQYHTTSLVVGYRLPNDRSEVASLIADIYTAFDIVIGVIDFRSLLRLVAAIILEGKEHNPDELRNLHGIIDISDT